MTQAFKVEKRHIKYIGITSILIGLAGYGGYEFGASQQTALPYEKPFTQNNPADPINNYLAQKETGTARASNPVQEPIVAMSLLDAAESLRAKLEANPNNKEGWILLGRTYANLGESELVNHSFQRAVDLFPQDIDILISHGEALALMNNGQISLRAKSLFQNAQAIDPTHPGAEFHLANYDFQNGNVDQAKARWQALADAAPLDAPWRETVLQKLRSVSNAPINEPPTTAQRGAMPTLDQNTVQAAMAMDSGDRNKLIETMVSGLAEKLEANPNDIEGWLRLGRSYGVLGQWQKADAAYAQALTLAPNDTEIQNLQAAAQRNYRR